MGDVGILLNSPATAGMAAPGAACCCARRAPAGVARSSKEDAPYSYSIQHMLCVRCWGRHAPCEQLLQAYLAIEVVEVICCGCLLLRYCRCCGCCSWRARLGCNVVTVQVSSRAHERGSMQQPCLATCCRCRGFHRGSPIQLQEVVIHVASFRPSLPPTGREQYMCALHGDLLNQGQSTRNASLHWLCT
jgi:hypothetical protein